MVRDEISQKALKKLGWKCLVIWECQLNEKDKLTEKIVRFMEDWR